MSESSKSKRGWVKTAAIVFLAVMLVLTFFSNTIMNRSTPEVSYIQVSSGTITQRIRGSGVVEANSSFVVKVQETRKVLSVLPRVGDYINLGDLLIILASDASAELSAAKQELESLEYDYQLALLTAAKYDYSGDDRSISRARDDLERQIADRDKLRVADYELTDAENAILAADAGVKEAKANIDTLKAAVVTAEDRVKQAQLTVDAYQAEIDSVNESISGISPGADSSAELERIAKKLSEAQAALRTAQSELESYRVLYSADYEQLQKDAISDLMTKDVEKAVLATVYQNDTSSPKHTYSQWFDFMEYYTKEAEENGEPPTFPFEHPYDTFPDITEGNIAFENMTKLFNDRVASELASSAWKSKLSVYIKAQALKDAAEPTGFAFAEITKKETAVSNAQVTVSELQTEYSKTLGESRLNDADTALYNQLNNMLKSLKASQATARRDVEALQKAVLAASDNVLLGEEALAEKNKTLTDAKAALTDLEARVTQWENAGLGIQSAERSLEDAVYSLASRKENDSTAQKIANMNLSRQREALEAKRELVEKLETGSVSSELTAPVSGIVRSVGVSPGDTTVYDAPLITIEQSDRGYSLVFSIRNDQAALVRVGDIGDVGSYWWGDKPVAVLKQIRSDPNNPREQKQLVFEISGSGFDPGYSLNITLSSSSDYYEAVIPASALKTDANGDFVLLMKERSSPLGKRYVASRADVRVLARDDNSVAVSGISAWQDYVIVSSAYPISSGDYVRGAAQT